MTIVRINKRTILASQYWTVAVLGALTAGNVALAVALGAVGAYLLAPVVAGDPRPSKFLLRAK